jgi:hypothetical protein
LTGLPGLSLQPVAVTKGHLVHKAQDFRQRYPPFDLWTRLIKGGNGTLKSRASSQPLLAEISKNQKQLAAVGRSERIFLLQTFKRSLQGIPVQGSC